MPDESRAKPQPLQPEEMKAIEARCEAAAPGPWKREGDVVYTGHECGDTCERTLHDHFVFADPDVKPADAEFIAHARTDIPRLIATIEEARREQPVRAFATELERRLANVIALSENVLRGQVWPHGGNSFAKSIADAARGKAEAILPANAREQPVRVTAIPRPLLEKKIAELDARGYSETEQAAFDHGARWGYALAATPKDGTDG